MAHRITTGVFEPVVVQAHEFAAEFARAGDAGLATDTDSGSSTLPS
jgi:hypothetical protein